MLGLKVAPIELGEALLEQQVVLEVVAVILFQMAVVGGLVFLSLPGESGKKWRSMVGGYGE